MSENYVLLRTTRRGSLRITKIEFLEGSKDEELGDIFVDSILQFLMQY
jgi:hypothetical protein